MQQKKKKMNIILYSILMLIAFFIIAEIIIYNYGGSLLAVSIFNYPYGRSVICEAILAIMVFVVMLIFRNSYVFNQKRVPLKKSLRYGMFYLLTSGIIFVFFGEIFVFFQGISTLYAILNLALESILIGIAEEFLCRGWLLNEFLERYGDCKKRVWYCIILSGVIFGLMHMGNYFYKQDLATTITQAISAIGTGIFFGLIYYKTKNIWSVVILHALWDFSLMLTKVGAIYDSTESFTILSITSIIFALIGVFGELLNIIPYIKDIDAEPPTGKIVSFALISIAIYLVALLCRDVQVGDTYEYGSINMDNYAVTEDNYDKYYISYESYSFELSDNPDDKYLLFTNLNTSDSLKIEYSSLYDYIIVQEDEYYILAYVDLIDSNTYLKYVYLDKNSLSNDPQYLQNLNSNINKFLLPDEFSASLVVVGDYANDISYLAAYDVDHGYYLLTDFNQVDVLNRD